MSISMADRAQSMTEEIIHLRRELHAHPELGMTLPHTVQIVTKELDRLGISYTLGCGGASVIATLGGKNPGKVMLLRGDMDALPITETTDLPYASENEHQMHACGHDLHTAMLLGAARLLKEQEYHIQGTVKLMFQPGEEIFAGAKQMIAEGVLHNPEVDSAFAMHVASILPLGTLTCSDTPMASCDGFKITLWGTGGHGAYPHTTVDPINAGVHLHLALQALISRECDPLQPAVLTFGSFQAGQAANVIPDRAVLQGTLRTFNAKTRAFLLKRLKEVTQGTAETFRTTVDFESLSDIPPLACDHLMNETIAGYIHNLYDGKLRIATKIQNMGSEDFAFVAEKVPTAFFIIGAGLKDPKDWVAGHNPNTQFNEDCLPMGSAIYAEAALRWLEDHS